MKKINLIKHTGYLKRITLLIMVMSMSFVLLTGCQYRITDKSVEEEVADALAEAEEQWKIQAEQEKNAAVNEALKSYESDKQDLKDEIEEAGNIEAPDASAMTDDSLDQIEIAPTEADNQGNEETAVEDNLQIVFMGDSIFDSVRDETGIAHMVGAALGADIYNLSIGGTTAALRSNKTSGMDDWIEPNFVGVVFAMENKIDRSILTGLKAGEVMDMLVPSKTDYFIIQYGTNDFTSYIPIGGDGGVHYKFSTALEIGIRELKDNYPDAKIILCTPYYMQFWSADRTRFIGDSHSVNNGYGTHLDYIGWAEGIGHDMGVECLNMYDLLAVDGYNVERLTEDGIHPNEELRARYAQILINKINELEEE